jgi:hypothetical protein
MMTEITAAEVLKLSEQEVKTSQDRPKLIRMLRALWAHYGNDPQALRAVITLETPAIATKLWEQIARNGGARKGASEEVPYDPLAATPPPMPAPPAASPPPGPEDLGEPAVSPTSAPKKTGRGKAMAAGPPGPMGPGISHDEIRDLVKEAVASSTAEMTKHLHDLKGEVAVLLEENRELSRRISSFGEDNRAANMLLLQVLAGNPPAEFDDMIREIKANQRAT